MSTVAGMAPDFSNDTGTMRQLSAGTDRLPLFRRGPRFGHRGWLDSQFRMIAVDLTRVEHTNEVDDGTADALPGQHDRKNG
jgi:hypothetical protein